MEEEHPVSHKKSKKKSKKHKEKDQIKKLDIETMEEKEEDLQREETAKLSNASPNPNEGILHLFKWEKRKKPTFCVKWTGGACDYEL